MITKERLTELADKNTIRKVSHEERVALATELLELRQQLYAGMPEQDDDDGWIQWCGGACPVAAGACTEVKFRCGETSTDTLPEYWNWERFDGDKTIVAYRIVS